MGRGAGPMGAGPMGAMRGRGMPPAMAGRGRGMPPSIMGRGRGAMPPRPGMPIAPQRDPITAADETTEAASTS